MPSVHVSELIAHPHQAAGHPGTLLLSADGTKVAKPALPREAAFYESLAHDLERENEVTDLSWRPQYFGKVEGTRSGENQLILLENVVRDAPAPGGFTKPTVLDLKLGTQLWDPDSSAEKRERMEQTSRETTSYRWGLRVTGGKVWLPGQTTYDVVAKEVGKGLKPDGSDLLPGLTRFFPVSGDSTTAEQRVVRREPQAMPAATMVQLLKIHIVPGIRKILATVAPFAWRVYGSSLLIVYEGDPDEAAARLRGDKMDPVATVKMIDFAHAWPGEGRDEGLLLGFQTTLDLFERLVAEMEALS